MSSDTSLTGYVARFIVGTSGKRIPADVTGIGPEIASKVLAAADSRRVANLVAVGDRRVLDLGIRDAGVKLSYTAYSSIDEVRFPRNDLALVDLGNIDPAAFKRGASSADSGRRDVQNRASVWLRSIRTVAKAACSGTRKSPSSGPPWTTCVLPVSIAPAPSHPT